MDAEQQLINPFVPQVFPRYVNQLMVEDQLELIFIAGVGRGIDCRNVGIRSIAVDGKHFGQYDYRFPEPDCHGAVCGSALIENGRFFDMEPRAESIFHSGDTLVGDARAVFFEPALKAAVLQQFDHKCKDGAAKPCQCGGSQEVRCGNGGQNHAVGMG